MIKDLKNTWVIKKARQINRIEILFFFYVDEMAFDMIVTNRKL